MKSIFEGGKYAQGRSELYHKGGGTSVRARRREREGGGKTCAAGGAIGAGRF